jgi:hypothetical protein
VFQICNEIDFVVSIRHPYGTVAVHRGRATFPQKAFVLRESSSGPVITPALGVSSTLTQNDGGQVDFGDFQMLIITFFGTVV